MEQQRAKVLKMKEVRDEAAVLQREVEHAQRAYDGVMARLNLTNLESQNTLTNATVLMPATEPAKPSSPQLVFNMAVALGAGACAALALALLREVTDRRVRTLEDISRGMGLPVLGVLLGRARRNWLGRMRPHPIPPRLLGRSRSYRRAALSDGDLDPVSALLAARTAAPDRARASGNGDGGTRNTAETIGQLIRNHRTLSDEQIDQILEHQRAHGIRFGESAVALGLANEADVVRALARQFQYPVTEALPAAGIQPELVVAHRPFSPQAEAFRGIRAQLMMRLQVGRKDQRRAIAVISHDSGDGRSYAAANLAVAFSQLGGRTLLIDADLRAPRQHRVFALEGVDGLSNVLSGRVSSYTLPSVPALPSLFVLPVGVVPPNPQELLEQPAFDRLLADVLQKFDHVVVDTPAFRHGMDSMVVAGKCGAAVIIARRHRSHSAAMQDLVACLSETPAELAGVLVNEH